MTTPGGIGALGPGAISIVAECADDRICSVRVSSSRPVHLTRLFLGRPAREIPILAERLYSLCGLSHALAAREAIGAARGESGATRSPARTIGPLCERICETLRSCATIAGGDALALGESASRPLREIFSLAREIAAAASNGAGAQTRQSERIRALVDELGLAATADPRTFFGRLRSEIENDRGFVANVPDALAREDDAAVVDELRRGGESFAAAPTLFGRTAETGAFARFWREVDLSRGALRARLQARMIDLARCVESLSGGEDDDLWRSGAFAAREGFAAVETSRGLLYHWARLDPDDRIANYAVVAPTEWNFHHAGPLVAQLLGARVSREGAYRSIARLAALFDPCVAFRVEVLEAARA